MKQASLKLKSYASNINIIDNGNLQKQVLHVMLWIFSLLAFFYIFSLGNMVLNIIERKALEKHALVLSNDVGLLELEYLSLSEKVNLDLAYLLGFEETKIKFMTRQTIGSIEVAKNEI